MYTIKTEFDGTCKIQNWQNSSLRVGYYMAYGPWKNQFKGKTYRIKYDYETGGDGEKVLVKENTTELFFNNSIAFDSTFEVQFSK